MSFVHFSLCIQLRADTVLGTWDPSVNKGAPNPCFYGISLPAEGDRQTENATSLSYRGCSKVRNATAETQSSVGGAGRVGHHVSSQRPLQGFALWCRVR